MGKFYKKRQAEIKDEQSNLSYEEIQAQMRKESEFVLELDKLPAQDHLWTNRGAKATCENAGHAMHEFWFRKAAM